MKRALVLAYGGLAYAAFLGVFAALVDFLVNAGFVRAIDGGRTAPWPAAVAIDAGLIAVFGVSHSVMARGWFKRRWTRVVPVAAERSTYVLVASLALALLVWQWRAIPAVVWHVEHPVGRGLVWGVFGAGLALVLVSTFLTSHLDLFGLRQVWLYARGRDYTPVELRVRSVYDYVRHPMMAGLLLAFWATPTMSAGHALLAAGMSVYIAVGVAFEERDLLRSFGEPYRQYRRRVRAILPLRR